MICRLKRSNRGGVLIEFALGAIIVLSVLVTTIEFGVEMFVRQSVVRAGTVASSNYAETRSIVASTSAMENSSPAILDLCSQPLDVKLFNAVTGVDMSDPSSGYPAQDSGADAAASIALVTYNCEWQRTTPLLRAMMGDEVNLQTSVIVRMRD
jgi:Flp pilus assembly protein TadG